jgi:hypothetical protein
MYNHKVTHKKPLEHVGRKRLAKLDHFLALATLIIPERVWSPMHGFVN